MPMDHIDVYRVDRSPTDVQGVTGFLVSGTHTDGTLGGFQVHTANEFAASLCQRSMELQRPIEVVWKDGRHGRQLVTVQIVYEQRSPDGDGRDPAVHSGQRLLAALAARNPDEEIAAQRGCEGAGSEPAAAHTTQDRI